LSQKKKIGRTEGGRKKEKEGGKRKEICLIISKSRKPETCFSL
jgi:hypothetical protein